MKFNAHPQDNLGFMRPKRKKWKTVKKWRKTRKHYSKDVFSLCSLNALARRTVQAFERFGVGLEKAARAMVRDADKQNKIIVMLRQPCVTCGDTVDPFNGSLQCRDCGQWACSPYCVEHHSIDICTTFQPDRSSVPQAEGRGSQPCMPNQFYPQ